MGEDGQGLALPLVSRQSCEALLPCRMIPEAEDGRFGERPRARRLADGGAGGAGAFPGRCLGALDQAARGGALRHPRDAVDLMDCREQHEAEDRADAGHRVPQIPGRGVRVRGGVDDGACNVAQPRIVVGEKREINCEALWHRRVGTALGDSIAVAVVSDFFAKSREGIRAVGMWDRGQECAACAGQGQAAAQEVTRRAPLGRRDRGLWQHPAAQEDGDFLGVARVMFGLAALDGLHREGMTEDRGDTVFSTEGSKPVPRQQACGREDDLSAGGGDGLEQRLWGGGHVPVQQRFTSVVEDANVHGAGVEVDAAVQGVVRGGESPEVSSSSLVFSLLPAYHGGMWRRGPQ